MEEPQVASHGDMTLSCWLYTQAPLLESADDWKVQFDIKYEGVSVKERPLPSDHEKHLYKLKNIIS